MNTYLRDVSVMLVDDQEFSLQILREMARVLGAEDIRTFTSAAKAWKDFCIRPADIVILDWQMEPMNGLELTRLIRKDADSPNTFVPIIMVTGFRERHQVFEARDAGVTEYVVKPLAPKSLFSRIEAVIERPRRFVRVGDFFGPDRRRHNAGYDGEDRRGKGAPKGGNGANGKQDMGQDEINVTFNPDDAPDVRQKAESAD